MGRTKDFSDLDTAINKTKKPAPDSADSQRMSRTLSLRLPEGEYERLRVYAFNQRKSHQAVMREALIKYLDNAGG